MINALIDKNGMHRLDIVGNGAEVVAEFGYMINQYCSAVKKCCPQALPALLEAFAALTAPDRPVWTMDENVEGIFLKKEVGK